MRGVVVLALVGCVGGGKDECTPTGSELARCATDHQLHACVYDAANERYLSIETACDAPYTCKDSAVGARCTADPDPYPACATANVDRVGDQLLTGAALARDHHRRLAGRDLIHDLEDALHRRADTDDVVRRHPIANACAQLAGLAAELLLLEHLVEHDEELVEVERLGQVLGGTRAHRIDRRGHRAERRHHDDGGGVLHRAQLLDQLDPVHPGHLEIGHHDVRGERLELAERLEGIGRGLDVVPLIAEELRQGSARVDFVVDNEDAAGSSHGGTSNNVRARKSGSFRR